jgi:hypothetical protein
MVKKVVQVDIQSKGAKKLDKDLESIEKNLKDIDKQADKTFDGENLKKFQKESVKTGEAVKSVKTRLRELEDEMADIGDVGSPQFQKLAKEAGVLKDKVNNAKAATKAMSSDFPKLQLGVQAFQAMGGAAQGAIGVTQLLGSENEEITKGIQKMMAVQSILNGVNSVANALSDETALGLKIRTVRTNVLAAAEVRAAGATKGVTLAQKALAVAQIIGAGAMGVLNFVMSLNPVFILIAAFALLAGAFAWFSSDSETAAEKSEVLNKSMDRQAAALEKILKLNAKLHENRMRELALQEASEKEVHEAKLQRLSQEEKERVVELGFLKRNYKKQAKLYKEALAEEDSETATSIRERIESDRERLGELRLNAGEYDLARREEEKDYSEFLKSEEDKRTAEEEKQQQKRLAAWKSYNKNRISARRLAQDLHDQIEGDEITANNIKFERLIEDTKKNQTLLQSERRDIIASYETLQEEAESEIIAKRAAKRDAELLKINEDEAKKLEAEYARQDAQFKLLNELRNTDRESEVEAIVSDYEAKFLLATGNKELEKELELAQSEELNALRDADAAKEAERIQASFDRKVQTAQDYASSVNSLAQGIFEISNNIGKQDDASKEKRAKRQFNINKGLQLGMAVIDGFRAVTSSLALSPVAIGPIPNPAGIASLALAASTTALNIGKISTSKYKSGGGGGGGGGGASAPSIGAIGGGGSQPASFNVVGNSGTNQLAESLGNQPPVQAFVVGSEVTTQQSLDRNKIDSASM